MFESAIPRLNVLAPNNPNIGHLRASRFWQYFVSTFLQGSFAMHMWNHFENKHERTNNRVEGDNNKMKVCCGASDPNIDKAIVRSFSIGQVPQCEKMYCESHESRSGYHSS
jgi:hypothetical protein